MLCNYQLEWRVFRLVFVSQWERFQLFQRIMKTKVGRERGLYMKCSHWVREEK